MPKPRGVFFGTSEFAVPAFHAFASETACALVVTQPDRPAGRGQRLQPTPVKRAALERGIPTLEPVRLGDAFDALRDAAPELFAVASYGKIISQRILDLAPLGALNVHPSLLPLYRGATPLQSQLRDGVVRSGVTIIAMDAGMDTGDVVLQARSAIGLDETYGELHDRFATLGGDLLGHACRLVAAGTLARVPQALLGSDADARATSTRVPTKADLAIEWRQSATSVVDRIRSLAPQPAARAAFPIESGPIKILKAHVATPDELASLDPLARSTDTDAVGVALMTPSGLFVRCGSGFVCVDALVPPNRGSISGLEYARLDRHVNA